VAVNDPTCSYCGIANDARPRSPSLDARLAKSMESFRDKRYAEVIEICEGILAEDPENVEAHYQCAGAWEELGQPLRVMQAIRSILALRPGSALVHFNLGILEAHYGDRAEAISRLKKALSLLNRDPDKAISPPKRDEIRTRARQELRRLLEEKTEGDRGSRSGGLIHRALSLLTRRKNP